MKSPHCNTTTADDDVVVSFVHVVIQQSIGRLTTQTLRHQLHLNLLS